MKPFRKKNTSFNKLDIAPLIDVMFMLLLFFLLTSAFITPSIKIKLPDGSNIEKNEDKAIIVSMRSNDEIYLNNEKTDMISFPGKFKNLVLKSKNKSTTFRGEKNISYDMFIKAIDIMKNSGAMEINIAHE